MDATLDCEKTLAEEFAHFDYDFSRKDQFTVTMPYNESEYGTCFRGNRLTFSMDSGVIKLAKAEWVKVE